jgi:diguanylate cyclase (GGDEF)-like protein
MGTAQATGAEQLAGIEQGNLERLLCVVGRGGRALVAEATLALVKRFGERGSCILVGAAARVVLSTDAPDLTDLSIDLARYPEITAALSSRDIVAIDDVRRSTMLESVAAGLPAHLGAVVVIPLVAGPRCLGVITVRSERPHEVLRGDVAAARLEGRLTATLLHLQFGDGLDDELRVRESAASARSSHLPSATKRRILVGEDDVDQAAMVEAILTGEGFEVALTRNGADLLEEAHRALPDLILLDGNMPILNGFHTAEKLHLDPYTSAVPVLFLSGAKDLLARMRHIKPDTIDFLRKPYSPPDLLARIDRALSQRQVCDDLRAQADVDALTGLDNARALRRGLVIEQSRILRYGATSAIVMIDVDKLKAINDQHGHVVGSRILHAIGELLRITIRETDLAARYGGDEFVVILAQTSVAEGAAFAERFLVRIRELRPEGIEVTLSLGVASLGGSGDQNDDTLLADADAAAYRAKQLGGNRVCVFDGDLDPAATSAVAPKSADVLALPSGRRSSTGPSQRPR